MKRVLKWALTGLLTIALLAVAAAGTGLLLEQRRLARTVHIDVSDLTLPRDAHALVRGKYLFESRGCTDCHGMAGEGRSIVEASGVHLAGPDITRGGTTRDYTLRDWVRAVRHGVAPGGRPLRVMPSEDYNRLTDDDLGALVAYLNALPPAGGATAVVKLPLPARVLYGLGLENDAVDRIDHRLPPPATVPEGATVEHGRYVAQGCVGCHGSGLGGGRIPGSPPHWPHAPRLAPGDGSVMPRYAELASFRAMMKSGQRPDGSAVAVMPFETLARLSEVDLQALHLYLGTTQEARPAAR